MLTVGLYQATTKAEIDSPTLPRPHSVHLEAVAVKSKQASRFTGLQLGNYPRSAIRIINAGRVTE